MPKNFFNKHKISRFSHKFLKKSHLNNIDKVLPSIKQEGKALVITGQILTAAGVLTAQPELAALGVGVTTGGEVLKGGSAKNIAKRIGGDLGGQIAGPGGARVGAIFGSEIGEKFDEKRKEEDNRTHNEQLKDQILENQHINDKENQHNQVSLPGDLQAVGGNNTGIVGGVLAAGVDKATEGNNQELQEGIGQIQNLQSILKYLAENFDKLENLSPEDEGDVFDSILQTGFLDEFINDVAKQSVNAVAG